MEEFDYQLVADAPESARITFYKKTYIHVALAILAFVVVESLFILTIPSSVIELMFSGKFVWLFILGLFWLASTMANRFVMAESRNTQYLGLGIYVLLEAIIFLPMIYVAVAVTESANVLMQAALFTMFLFAGLTYLAFTSTKDFSFLRSVMIVGGFVSLGLIVVGAIFGFELGLWFSLAMILLAGGSILYNTQKMKDEYHTEQYVGAALQLFASIMLMYWYVLRIMSRRN